MTKHELANAMAIAESDASLSHEDTTEFLGFGLTEFTPVYVTTHQVAALIRYQCFMLNGNIDSGALQEIANYGRLRFKIIN